MAAGKRGCGLCRPCEVEIFTAWEKRVRRSLRALPKSAADDKTPRMQMIHEIHASVGCRHPLGIAQRLYEVINSLHIGDRMDDADEEAISMLNELAEDDSKSFEGDEEGARDEASACPVAEKMYNRVHKAKHSR